MLTPVVDRSGRVSRRGALLLTVLAGCSATVQPSASSAMGSPSASSRIAPLNYTPWSAYSASKSALVEFVRHVN